MILLQEANDKGGDQTGQKCRLVCMFVVRKRPNSGILASGPNNNITLKYK